jgi:hypothetical protein
MGRRRMIAFTRQRSRQSCALRAGLPTQMSRGAGDAHSAVACLGGAARNLRRDGRWILLVNGGELGLTGANLLFH